MRQRCLFLLTALLFVAGCATSTSVSPAPVNAGAPDSVTLAGYVFHYPEWWHDVDVPELPASANSEGDARDFVDEHFGADTGTPDTWRSAMKVWVAWYARSDEFPIYIGHAYRMGREFDAAARTFAELHPLSRLQGEYAEWYSCYVAFNAGEAYTEAGRYEEAREWYRVAAQHESSEDDAVRHYGGLAAERAELDDEALVRALEE